MKTACQEGRGAARSWRDVFSTRADALFEAFAIEEGIEELDDLAAFTGAALFNLLEAAL